MKILFKIFLVLLIFSLPANADIVKIFQFTKDEFKKLKVRKVKGETKWALGSNENGNYIRAEAEGTGSGLGKEVIIDLNKTPFINITWKVEKNLSGIIANSKKGHDYAARVFVVKKLDQQHCLIEQLITFFLAIIMLVKLGEVHIPRNLLIMF